jgi:hypothetical protein
MEEEEDEITDQEIRGNEAIVTRSGRIVKKPAYLKHYVLSAMSYSDDDPQSYSENEDGKMCLM